MENNIRNYVDLLFFDLPNTYEVNSVREKIIKETLDRYHSMVNDGYDVTTAFQKSVESIGDISALKKSLSDDISSDPRVSALPKSVQSYASVKKDNIKAEYRKSGNGKVVAIGCLTGFIIFALIVGLIITLGVIVLRSVDSHTLDNIKDMKPGEIIDSVKDVMESNVKDVFTSSDGISVSMNDNEVTVGKSWSKDHFEFDNEFNADGQYSIPADGINKIVIDWVAGEVLITAEDRDDILINEECDDKDPVSYGIINNTLYIYYRGKVEQSQYKMKIKSVTIGIPDDLAKILTGIEIDSVSADCKIKNAELYMVDMETVSGNFTLESICRCVDFESVSGDFNFIGDACPNEVDISTISGDSSFFVNIDNGFTIEFDTISGDVESELPLTQTDKEHYSYGNGASKIEIESTSGDLFINEK